MSQGRWCGWVLHWIESIFLFNTCGQKLRMNVVSGEFRWAARTCRSRASPSRSQWVKTSIVWPQKISKCVCLHFGSKSLSQQKAKTCKTSWPCSAFYTKGYIIEPRLVKLSLHNSPQKKPMLRHVLAWTGPIGRRRGKHRCLQNSCCNLRNAFSRIRLSSTANHLAFRSCFGESRKAI